MDVTEAEIRFTPTETHFTQAEAHFEHTEAIFYHAFCLLARCKESPSGLPVAIIIPSEDLSPLTNYFCPVSKTVIVIAGPTAVGKTALSIQLAQHWHTDIISADSRQCYREMTIGTAKPTAAEQAAVRHWFIDSHTLNDSLSAADYEAYALAALNTIFKTNDIAVVCGGTGLYIKALCEGLDEMPPVDAAVEQSVLAQYEAEGISWLQQVVAAEDPVFFAQGEIQNPARLLRALIFRRSTGESITQYQKRQKKERPFRMVKIGLNLPRQLLYERINHRVDLMMAQGLLEEVQGLWPLVQSGNVRNKALLTVGYAELFDYLSGKGTLEEAVALIQQHSRNYAKRQLTWFQRDEEFHWFDARDEQLFSRIVHLL